MLTPSDININGHRDTGKNKHTDINSPSTTVVLRVAIWIVVAVIIITILSIVAVPCYKRIRRFYETVQTLRGIHDSIKPALGTIKFAHSVSRRKLCNM